MSEQLHVILVYLQRPAVWQQWLAFLLAVAVAWVLAKALGARTHLNDRVCAWLGLGEDSALRPLLALLGGAVFPVFGLALVWAAEALFRRWSRPAGLLGEWVFLLWLILGYRVAVAILAAWLGEERKRPFRVRLLAPMVGIFATLRVLGLLVDLEALAKVPVLMVSDSPVLLGTLFNTVLVLYFLFAFSWFGQAIAESAVLPSTKADPGMVHAALTIARYAAIVVGVSFALGALGFDTSTVAFISGGLTVALGFGSQQVFSNLVAGVLLLFDQSLRPGDVISVAGELGVVETLSIRATTMRTADNVAVVMPNQSFVTGAIRNYSKNSTGVRLQLPLAVAHAGEPQRLRAIALDAVRDHKMVLAEPSPAVLYTSFGMLPSGKHRTALQITAWLSDPLYMPEVTSELLLAIRDALAEAGMEMV
jgi:small-conductance mechanosensitive channel